MIITMLDAAKKMIVCPNALAFGQMHTAMLAAHHIVGDFFVLQGVFSMVRLDQQVNHNGNGK
jgi:hypothetical protein